MWAWSLVPISFAIWSTVGLWIVYFMSVSNGSVNISVAFPYISTCGSYPPQSCVFGQVLNVGAILAVWVTFIRFQQVRDLGCHSRLNIASAVLGVLSALGISMVGNFQQSNQLETHLVGAVLAFFVGVAYFWLQTIMTYRVTPRHGGRWLGPYRFLLCTACTVLIVMMGVLHSQNLKSAAAICEWIAAMILFLLFALFAVEFRHIEGHFFHVQKTVQSIPHQFQVSTVTLGV
ncbi:modulator of macroautophagy TMEM150B [Ambystoma mexicanum]|uniref:modulator of macroautophagy TMEM150B n=1 Tax=Ambystoma mexicanum TaxID=8296 RepID=UPI0037E8463A